MIHSMLRVLKCIDNEIYEHPQERCKGKASGEIRKEALTTDTSIIYPVKPNKKIKKILGRC